jgi:urease accessory protein UreH
VTAVGVARLRFVHRAGVTVLDDAYTEAPLHARPVISASPTMARVLLLRTGGGLLGEEQLQLELLLGANAQATVAAVGATRLLRAARTCRQQINVRLECRSRLLLLPEPLIPCAGAAYEQIMHIDLDESATFIGCDLVTAGRIGSGERFAYRRLDLHTVVQRSGQLVLRDRVILEPAAGYLRSALGSWTHLATLTAAGLGITDAGLERLRDHLEAAQVYGGATLPAPGIAVARMLGRNAHELHELLRRMAVGLIEDA